MFGVKALRQKQEKDYAYLLDEIRATDRAADSDRAAAASKRDLDALLAYLKLEINTVPAEPEKRVVEKAGTRAKRAAKRRPPSPFTQTTMGAASVQQAMLGSSYDRYLKQPFGW